VPVEEPWRQRSYGEFLYALGLYREAIAAYERALVLDPGVGWTRYALGLAYWSAGERARAVAEWRRVVQEHPDHARARNALAQAERAGVR
jgi:tetratricopeptide (TPR) repeat protein